MTCHTFFSKAATELSEKKKLCPSRVSFNTPNVPRHTQSCRNYWNELNSTYSCWHPLFRLLKYSASLLVRTFPHGGIHCSIYLVCTVMHTRKLLLSNFLLQSKNIYKHITDRKPQLLHYTIIYHLWIYVSINLKLCIEYFFKITLSYLNI